MAISSYAPKIPHLSGRNWIFTKFSLDSRPAAPQQELFTSTFLAFKRVSSSAAHLCVSYTPLHRWKSWIFFSWKTLQTRLEIGLQPMFKRLIFDGNHAVSVQVKKDVLCPAGWLEQCSVSILRCKPRIFTLHGFREHHKGSNCQVETPLDFHSHSAAFSFATLNLCSLRRPLAAQSRVQSSKC